MLGGIDIVYWINLDRSPDRRANMNEVFSDSEFDSLKVVRFSAVDYKKLNVLKFFNINEVRQRNNLPEYACFLSHLETIRQFSESEYSDDSVALIMEDDATLDYKPYWKKPISNVIKNAPSDWEIIMLGYMFDEGFRIPNINLFPDYIKNDINKIYFASTISYLINKRSAKKIINTHYKNVKYHLIPTITHHHSDYYLFNYFKTYVYKYPYFSYKTENDSYLHPDHLDNHKRCKLQISKMLYGIKPVDESNYEGFIDSGIRKLDPNIIFAVLFFIIFVVFLYYYRDVSPQISTYTKKLKLIFKTT